MWRKIRRTHAEPKANVPEHANNNTQSEAPYKKKKRSFFALFLSGVSLVGLVLTILFVPPSEPLQLLELFVSPIIIASALICMFLFFGTLSLFKSYRHAWLVTLFALSAILLRLNNLTEPLFFFLLLGVFIMLELLLRQKQ